MWLRVRSEASEKPVARARCRLSVVAVMRSARGSPHLGLPAAESGAAERVSGLRGADVGRAAGQGGDS